MDVDRMSLRSLSAPERLLQWSHVLMDVDSLWGENDIEEQS